MFSKRILLEVIWSGLEDAAEAAAADDDAADEGDDEGDDDYVQWSLCCIIRLPSTVMKRSFAEVWSHIGMYILSNFQYCRRWSHKTSQSL